MIWTIVVGLVIGAGWYAKVLTVRKDGGPESNVTGYWLIELKWLFSVALLRFGHGSRESFHSHAFNCISWVFGPGELREEIILGETNHYQRSWRPVRTFRETFHRVFSTGTTWVLTFRGPWKADWAEYDPKLDRYIGLTSGRKVTRISDVPEFA
jgi:hypothetical protein